jgi:hypothetical protein
MEDSRCAVPTGSPSSGLFEALANFHEYPFTIAFVLVGLLGAASMFVSHLFRVSAEVVDAYYDFRSKCASAKARFQASGKEQTE